jgi:four helix bundle protein
MALLHYRELIGWQKAMDLVGAIYRSTQCFPADERFGLTLQMRRCAVSVPSNIAEGQGRGTPAEFVRFLRIANGSRQELETQLHIAVLLGYLTHDQSRPLLDSCEEVGRLMAGLIRSIE